MARRRDDWDEEDDDREPPRRSIQLKGSSSAWLWMSIGGVVLVAAIVVVIIVLKKSSDDEKASAGLVAHWSFDDVQGTTVVDQSNRKNNATLRGARLAEGARGQALWLDGQPDQFCELPASGDLNFSANAGFTFAGWFNTSLPSATILSMRNTQKNTQVDLVIREGMLMVIIGDDLDPGPLNGFVRGQRANDGRWHHFAFSRTGSSIELYLDGVSQGTGTGRSVAGPITTDLRALGSERLWIQLKDMQWGNPYYTGGIDEVRVYNRVLTAEEIKGLAK